MSIEIKGLPPTAAQNVGNSSQVKGQGDEANRPPRISDAAPSATVSLTSTSTRLRALEHELANQSVVDPKRVEAIRNSIQNGTYAIDSKALAANLLGLEGALHSKA